METSETVGRYKILEKLGSGSSGVFKGADSETGKSVVLKLVPDWLVEQYGPSFLSRLEKEVQASTHLKHPRIVQIFGFEAIQDHNYIVMEFVEGCDLPKETGVAVADAVCLGVQLLAALEYGHEQGVVHRNVKPSNILLS